MSRPFRTTTHLLLAFTVLNFAACTMLDRQPYAWKRNHFKPYVPPPKAKDKDLLPPTPTTTAPTLDAAPGLPAPAPAPAMDAAPAIPGL